MRRGKVSLYSQALFFCAYQRCPSKRYTSTDPKDCLVLDSDDVATRDVHYVDVFESFLAMITSSCFTVCLTLLRMENELTYSTDRHIMFFSITMSVCKKSFFNITSLIGNYCNTDQSICHSQVLKTYFKRCPQPFLTSS